MKFTTFKRHLRSFNLPTISLLALLQRTPVVQMAVTTEEFVLDSPIGTVLKSFAAVAASLGAMNSLAGATPLVPSSGSASGITVTQGTSVSVFYTVNGTQTPPQSWAIGGSIPPGLNFSGHTTAGVIDTQNLQLSGTPTAAGVYSLSIEAYEFTNTGGIGSPVYSYTITVNSGSSATAPMITTQPQSQTVTAGANVTFTVAASGSPAPTLQWKKGTTNISGATSTTLTLNNVQAGDAGTYTAVATNSAGTATSNGAVLTVNPAAVAPAFTTQPQSQTVTAGANVTFTVAASGSPAPTLQWQKNTVNISGATGTTLTLSNVQAGDAATYTAVATNSAGTVPSNGAVLTVNPATSGVPAVTTQPQNQTMAQGGNVTLTAAASGTPAPTFQWQFNGTALSGTSSTLAIQDMEPANSGIYSVLVTNTAGTTTSDPAIVGVSTTSAVIGAGQVLGTNILHPNGNHFDQVLVTGTAEAIATQGGRITRTSYIDLSDNIVQVEFSGAGTLSLVLDDATGPAQPLNYNQAVNYMKGHAGIVITGANESTNVLVFTVGRATAFDPTGTYNILLAPSATNVPANNGSPLFQGHASTNYDGVAEIAFIAIETTDGKFGGVRASNASFFASNGLTGVYAPGVAFQGPVYIGDIDAHDNATPVIVLGSVSDARITGGDLTQDNGQAVQVSGITQLKFTAGSKSTGDTLPAQNNHAVLKQNGQDVTAQIVVNP